MQPIGYRHQRTLATPAEVRGVGFITGARPAAVPARAPDTGLVFIRTDLPGRPATPARADRVTGTNRRTTLGPPETGVTLVEHVLAALAGLRIDNCRIELDGPEPPGLDGSACGFVEPSRRGGRAAAGPPRGLGRRRAGDCHAGGATIALHPPAPATGWPCGPATSSTTASAPIPRQAYTITVTPETFAHELAGCRTFLLEAEAHALRQQGIGRHLTPISCWSSGRTGRSTTRSGTPTSRPGTRSST